MFRWTAGTRARADRASRQHSYTGGPTRLLLSRRRLLHPLSRDAVTLPAAAAAATTAGTTVPVTSVSQSPVHSVIEHGCNSAAMGPPAPTVLNGAATDVVLVTEGIVTDTVIEGAAQTCACPSSLAKDTFPVLDVAAAGAAVVVEGGCSSTLKGATNISQGLCPAPDLSCNCSPPPPPPPPSSQPSSLHDGVMKCGNNSPEQRTAASSSPRLSVLRARHQLPNPLPTPLSGRATVQQQALPSPPLPSSSYASSTAQADRLLEELGETAAHLRARRRIPRGLSPAREVWRRHKRQRSDDLSKHRLRSTRVLTESSEEGMADTYAEIQQQRQRPLMEKQTRGEGWHRSLISDSPSRLPHSARVTECEERRRRQLNPRQCVAEKSVDCVAVQLPLQRAKEAPVTAPAPSSLASVSHSIPYTGVLPSTSIAERRYHVFDECGGKGHARACGAQDDDWPPAGTAVQVAADACQHDSCSEDHFRVGGRAFLWSAPGSHVNIWGKSLGHTEEPAGTYNSGDDAFFSQKTYPFPAAVGVSVRDVEQGAMSVFEDPSVCCYYPRQEPIEQHLLDRPKSAPGGELCRVTVHDDFRDGVAPTYGANWRMADPASAFEATPGVGTGADRWTPATERPPFISWAQLGSDRDTYAGALQPPGDGVVGPDERVNVGLGDTCLRFCSETQPELRWFASSVEDDCHSAGYESGWGLQSGPRSNLLTREGSTRALLVSRGISTAAPPLPGFFSSSTVPPEVATSSAFPWMSVDECDGETGAVDRNTEVNHVVSGGALPPCWSPYPLRGALETRHACRESVGGVADSGSVRVLSQRNYCSSHAQDLPTSSVSSFQIPLSYAATIPASTAAAAALLPHHGVGTARQRQRRRDRARPPRGLNGSTERCRRFWERWRQSHALS